MKPSNLAAHNITFLTKWSVRYLSALFVASAASVSAFEYQTKTGMSAGLSFSNYRYSEPGYMALDGKKIGLELAGTYAFNSTWPNTGENWMVRGEIRYSNGKVDYSSNESGTLNDKTDRYNEIRTLIGRDFDLGEYGILTYTGFGTRQLHNDLRGLSSTGASGYRRDSRINYIPVGLTAKTRLRNETAVQTTLEYNYLLRGVQTVTRSDVSASLSDLSLNQPKGFGLRAQTMFLLGQFYVGPSISYLKIDRSDISGTPPAFEPKNNTFEVAIKAVYQF